eukprot:302265-Pelagomonas_calceolata.AAC.2
MQARASVRKGKHSAPVGLPVLWVLDGQHSLSRHHLPVSCYLGQHPGAEPGPRRSSGKGCSFRA